MKADWLWIGQVAMAAFVDVAFAFAFGSALYAAWLEKDGRSPVSPARTAWLRAQRSLRAAALVLVIALALWLLYESASISASPLADAFGVVPAVLTQTHVGQAWAVAFAGSLLLLVSAFAAGGTLRDGALWLGVVVAAAGRAALGHAADAGYLSAALGLHVLHVLGAGAWSGVVMAGGLAVLPALGGSTARGLLIRTVGRASKVAMVAVALALVTGVFNGVRGSGGSFEALVRSTWGHVLLLKLVLVALALALGGYNRLVAMPRLRRSASTAAAHRFVNVIYLEAFVMMGVLVIAAALARSVPGYVMLHGG